MLVVFLGFRRYDTSCFWCCFWGVLYCLRFCKETMVNVANFLDQVKIDSWVCFIWEVDVRWILVVLCYFLLLEDCLVWSFSWKVIIQKKKMQGKFGKRLLVFLIKRKWSLSLGFLLPFFIKRINCMYVCVHINDLFVDLL